MIIKDTSHNTILAAGVYADSGESNYLLTHDARKVDVVVSVTSVDTPTSGEPKMDIKLMVTGDDNPGTAEWFEARALPTISTAGNYRSTLENGLCKSLRADYAGSNNFNEGEGFHLSIRTMKHLK